MPLDLVGGTVAGQTWAGPTGFCIAHFLQDNVSYEDDYEMGVIMDDTGQIWWVPTPFLRAGKNLSMLRNHPDKHHA